jgi:hypothetical protein
MGGRPEKSLPPIQPATAGNSVSFSVPIRLAALLKQASPPLGGLPHSGIERGHLAATPMAGKFARNEIPPPATTSVKFSTGEGSRINTVCSSVLIHRHACPDWSLLTQGNCHFFPIILGNNGKMDK